MTQDHDSLPAPTDGPSAIDLLPEEILARIVGLLQPCQLHWVERVNTRLRKTVVRNNLWREHCKKACHNFEHLVAGVDAESLRQVLKGLHALADADNLSKPASNNPISRLFSSAPLCSPNTSSSLPCSSPVLRSDSELTRSSPMRHVAHFWGPGLSPRAFPDTDLPLSNDSHSQPAATSILARLHQCCSRQRNLSSQGPIKKDAGSSNSGGSSKLWSFNTDLTEDVLTSMFYKRLCWQMGLGVAMESLIAEALQASSTDRPQEHIRRVLDPSTRIRGFMGACYWCSGPSDDEDSTETLDFKLAHPLCVVRHIIVQPFRAAFQPGSPVYAPKRVRFHFAGSLQDLASANQPHSRCTSTPEYPVENNDQQQHFRLPDTLCAGGFVRVELIGRVQRQQQDNRYYTCILYVKVRGTPVHGFLPKAPTPTLTPIPTPALLEHQLSPGASRQSCQTQTQLNPPKQGDADSQVQQSHGGLPDEAQKAEGQQQGFVKQQPPVVLKAVLDDPLLMAGGLLTVSEMGRMLTHHGDDQEEEDDEDDDDDLHGDSDGGDMALDQLEHALNADDFNLHPVDFDNFGMGIHVGPLGMPVHALQGGQMDGSDTDDDMEDYPVIYE
ncbi:hypothetical protein ABBQ32_009887 [Trebouxia sp. C0010 RCD-2024]